ncbi:hypothetical protein D3C73_1257580 [compost metagenome]
MQLAIFSGQSALTVKDKHTVGNAGGLPVRHGAGDDVHPVFLREARDQGFGMSAFGIGNFPEPGQVVAGRPELRQDEAIGTRRSGLADTSLRRSIICPGIAKCYIKLNQGYSHGSASFLVI